MNTKQQSLLALMRALTQAKCAANKSVGRPVIVPAQKEKREISDLVYELETGNLPILNQTGAESESTIIINAPTISESRVINPGYDEHATADSAQGRR